MSVWSGQGAEGETIGWTAIAWIAFTQLASAGVGGYIAGRLRTRWQGVHTDEVYFRDTAHGFLSWSLATLLMVALMGSVAGGAISGTFKAAGAVATGAANVVGGAAGAVGGLAGSAGTAVVSAAVGASQADGASSGSLGYWINGLFRNGGLTEDQKDKIKTESGKAAQTARSVAEDAQEATSIFVYSMKSGKLSDADASYVAQLITRHSDVSAEEAQEKVKTTFANLQQQLEQAKQKAAEAEAKAKQAAETARKAVAYSMLWLFVSLLLGGFVGSLSATWGGRTRDSY